MYALNVNVINYEKCLAGINKNENKTFKSLPQLPLKSTKCYVNGKRIFKTDGKRNLRYDGKHFNRSLSLPTLLPAKA